MSARRSLLVLLASAAPLAVLVGVLYGVPDGLITATLLLALGGVALAVAHFIGRRRSRLGSLRRQFAVGVGLTVGQIVVALAAGAAVMFVSTHDFVVAVVLAIGGGAVAARAAHLLARDTLADIDALRDTLVAVGEGSREAPQKPGSARELAELADAAGMAIAKLDQAEVARSNLIAAVSHDLRTPITSLRLLAEAVDDEIVDEDTRRRYLSQMRTHIRGLSDLIDDLFELSRLEAGEIRWALQRVSLHELVEETVEAMRAQAEAGGVSVRSEVPASLEPAHGHPEKLQRVLFNLIQNAIRHTPADGSVIVRAEMVTEALLVEVSDTGEGIGEADRSQAFEPFFRGGPEAARTRTGAGLGLAISRAIVEAHGGHIWLESGSVGTSVRFTLPTTPSSGASTFLVPARPG